MIVTYLEK